MKPAELKALRAHLGLSQAALAKKIGVARNTVNRWEMGVRRISRMAALLLESIRK